MASSSGCLVGLLLETLALPSADPARLISRIVLFVAFLYSEIVPTRMYLYLIDIVWYKWIGRFLNPSRSNKACSTCCSLSGLLFENI